MTICCKAAAAVGRAFQCKQGARWPLPVAWGRGSRASASNKVINESTLPMTAALLLQQDCRICRRWSPAVCLQYRSWVCSLCVFHQLSGGQCHSPARQQRGDIGWSHAGLCGFQLLIALTCPILLRKELLHIVPSPVLLTVLCVRQLRGEHIVRCIKATAHSLFRSQYYLWVLAVGLLCDSWAKIESAFSNALQILNLLLLTSSMVSA